MVTKHTAPPTPPDEAPDQTPVDEPVPEGDEDEHPPPAEASTLRAPDADADAPTWDPSYRSALDNPRHPLHHLKDA